MLVRGALKKKQTAGAFASAALTFHGLVDGI
jgi:hypothetical protein